MTGMYASHIGGTDQGTAIYAGDMLLEGLFKRFHGDHLHVVLSSFFPFLGLFPSSFKTKIPTPAKLGLMPCICKCRALKLGNHVSVLFHFCYQSLSKSMFFLKNEMRHQNYTGTAPCMTSNDILMKSAAQSSKIITAWSTDKIKFHSHAP